MDFKSLFRRLWQKPRPRRVLVRLTYRDYSSRDECVSVDPRFLTKLCEGLSDASEVREVRVYEERFYAHKSYAEDFDTENLSKLFGDVGESIGVHDELRGDQPHD